MPQGVAELKLLSRKPSTKGAFTIRSDDEPLNHTDGSARRRPDDGPVEAVVSVDTEPAEEEQDEAYEDYDAQALSADAVVASAAVGGDLSAAVPAAGDDARLRLQETERRGRYILTADDPEVMEVLRRSFERQRLADAAAADGGKARVRDLVFTRRFTTFDRQNPAGADSPFLGFFVLFWIAMGLLALRVAAQNHRSHGTVLGDKELMRMMFGRDMVVLGLTDAAMYLSTAVGLPTQWLVLAGWIDWDRSGWVLQNVWQASYLAAVVGWTFYRDWPWTHTIFVVLHGLVFLMKQHSYAFYNGYLSQVYKRRQALARKLGQLEGMSAAGSPTAGRRMGEPPSASSVTAAAATAQGSTEAEGLHHRRRPSLPARSANLSSASAEVQGVAAAISSGRALDADQMRTFSAIISEDLAAMDAELRGKCALTQNHYPHNLTIRNWAEWSCLPTLVYELEYPRLERINWAYVAEKTSATFGVLLLMQVISQTYIYPPILEAVRMKAAGLSLEARWREFPYLVLDMLFPLLLEQLLTWYVIWECVLNVLAELTYFADRGFYGPWWSSVSWDQYARDWNRPVHSFLLRHVYHSSISALHLSRTSATLVTFLLSALVHELLMFCLFRKVRGYLFTMQLMQVPLAMASRTKFLKGRRTLGNVIFWIGLFVGPSVIAGLYLVV